MKDMIYSLAEYLTEEIVRLAEYLTEEIVRLAEYIAKHIVPIVEAATDMLIELAPVSKRVKHLARYAKKKRVRKKNINRIHKALNKRDGGKAL